MIKDRISADDALKICATEEKGKLKIFLGYAPGVGKTYTMLNEANRRYNRGEDVVIGYFESHGRLDTINQIKSLPELPLKEISYNSITFKELNVPLIIERNPKLVLVDELAHTNAPGSKNKKRYEDVLEILNAGINVYATVNIQHLESLNDVISQITGVIVHETIPDSIIATAEIVVIDIPPDSLRKRLKRGNVYKTDLIQRALKNFFRIGNLNALRELTLRQIADEVDCTLNEYKEIHNIHDNWHTAEKVMVSISSNPKSKRLIRFGARIAKKYKCPLYVVYVNCTHSIYPKDNPEILKSLDENINLAKKFDATIVTLKGKSISSELIKFSKEKNITKLIIGHSKRTRLQKFFRGSTVNKLLEGSKNIEIIVVPYD
ncbi:histidine kinase [Clostridium baratii]|uniref:Osmosensitive K+ channel His kinase sensor n=1 Tax=Clostridium baratii TaxID=1561 RepID=A0A174PFD6_9CLOT|nr:universal stress protein [Clostridium baratii]OPF50387.1 histidine kinase [Clostridium baratii]OPF53212.1 histidine kinase [Clostridium baratii]OPF55228.1 histidine kinase [Clostridium baratii]OPF61178.1 histidine kinase [Clostridium baratii]CUP56619.1 osmosensitive K+ channel His kinase sensor [Clostridium baratii]